MQGTTTRQKTGNGRVAAVRCGELCSGFVLVSPAFGIEWHGSENWMYALNEKFGFNVVRGENYGS